MKNNSTVKKPVKPTMIGKGGKCPKVKYSAATYASNSRLLNGMLTMARAQLITFASTQIKTPSVIPFEITYPFYAKIKAARNKQFYPVLCGRNNEVVFTGETHKNKNDVVILLKMWFPQIEIKR